MSSACAKGAGWLSSSGLYASSPATTVMSLCSESELYSMLLSGSGTGRSSHERLVLWQKEHQSIGHGAFSCNLFLLDLSSRNSSPYCDSSLHSRSLEWHTLPFTILSIPQVLHTFYKGVNGLSLSSNLMPK